jgi:hypothetical protein
MTQSISTSNQKNVKTICPGAKLLFKILKASLGLSGFIIGQAVSISTISGGSI